MPCLSFPGIDEKEILTRRYNYHCYQHVDIGHDSMDARDFIYLTDQLESDRRKLEEAKTIADLKSGKR